MAVSPSDLREVDERLATVFGRYTDRHPEPESDLLEELIESLIGQRTTNRHARLAMSNLRAAFRSWAEVAVADPDVLADLLRPAGLARQKAGCVLGTLQQVFAERGQYSLQFLLDLPPAEAAFWLKRLPGVGDHTAALVLLFAGRCRGVMPVEANIERVARRLGWAPGGGRSAVQRAMESAGASMAMVDLHVNLIRVGRAHCREGAPDCPDCPLADYCPSFRPPW